MTILPIAKNTNIVPTTIALPTRILRPDAKLYQFGGEANFLYFVQSGVLKAVVPCSIGGQHAETVVALQTTYVIPFEHCYALADTKLSRYLVENLAQQVKRSREALAGSEWPVAARIAQLLLALSKRFGQPISASETIELTLPLTQEEIASLIHSSRVTVTRVLGELRDEGAITGSRGDYHMNPALLEVAADQYVLQAL
jgi:CRP/FNR family transcriptional regulator, cyclic AMP receptor protein